MDGEFDERDGGEDESKREGFATDREPLWARFEPSPGLKRDGSEADVGPSLDKNEPDAEPLQGGPGEFGEEAIREWREQLLRDISAGPAGETDFEEPRYEPLDIGPRFRGYGETGPRRRRRRWGQAARKAARNEAPEGERRPQRSLRAVREAFPLSQEELSDRTRISRSAIAAIEKGGRRPHPSTMRELARVLGVQAGEIRWW
jgi:DNA-binding XRE family transcriptional regulator